jgi:hypothetical protein
MSVRLASIRCLQYPFVTWSAEWVQRGTFDFRLALDANEVGASLLLARSCAASCFHSNASMSSCLRNSGSLVCWAAPEHSAA